MYSAICRIESYKHYQAGAIHKEAVRELTNYSNPNWHPERVKDNVYFERLEMDKPFEKWIYDFRAQNGIVGRYMEHNSNPKAETNAMCQFFATVPKYIPTLSREGQVKILRSCYDFFKQEFPSVPVLEAVCHFDEEGAAHLQVNFLPVVEREHKKRGKEKIFSTTLLMPGREYFPQLQDRFYAYMQGVLGMELARDKEGPRVHYAPKEYRELTAAMSSLEKEKAEIEMDLTAAKAEMQEWTDRIQEVKRSSVLDKTIELYNRIRQLEQENKFYKSFLSHLFQKYPVLETAFQNFRNIFLKSPNRDKSK